MVKKKEIAILFFTMIVVMLGFGIIIPILPFYVEALGASGKELGFLMAIFSIMQFIFSPVWGSLSDRIGRKPVLLIGVFGNALTQLLFGLSTTMWMMYGARALSGILSSATLPTAMAYIGDVTDEHERGGGMGVIGAAMGVGMVLGPGLGGWLGGQSLQLPFFFAAFMSVVAMVLIWLFLPESLHEHHRVQEGKMRGPQFGMMWRALFGPMGFLLFLAFLVNFALANFEGIFGLFAQIRYSYGPEEVGTVFMMIGIISTVIQLVLTGWASRTIGEKRIVQISLIASAIGFVLMVMAGSFIGVMVTVGFFVFSNAMLRPAIASIMSKEAGESQGMSMGLNNAFQSLGRIVGPVWAGFMLDTNVNFPYLSAAVVMAVTFGLSLVYLRTRPKNEPPQPGRRGAEVFAPSEEGAIYD